MPPVLDWGRRDYKAAHAAMRELVEARRAGSIGDTLVLVEHPPVITIGVQGDDGQATNAGPPVVHVERGGHATYHAPGQLVGYPIVDLSARGNDVRRFVHDLGDILVDALAGYGISAGSLPGQPGVWVDGQRKIASIGIAVHHWVTFHGFALNVDLDLTPFARFQPCGISGAVMTSISQELGRPVQVELVKAPVVRGWQQRFESGAAPARTDAVTGAGPSTTA